MMHPENDHLRSEYDELLRVGYALAGDLNDLPQRAAVYYHLYEDSGGQNIFPLMAAHGALWAKGYFTKGMLAGRFLVIQYIYNPKLLIERYASLIRFANAFRDINRRVCAEAYCVYHFSKKYGHTEFAREMIPNNLLDALNNCHNSKKNSMPLKRTERKALFLEFFLWEQETIVSPLVEEAIKAFEWPSVKLLAMKPKIEFAYFGKNIGLKFKDFSSKSERVEKGLEAYELAEKVGYQAVEQAIFDYGVMPYGFLADTDFYFKKIYQAAFSPQANGSFDQEKIQAQ